MGFRVLYDIVLIIISLFFFPKFYFDYLFKDKYKKSLSNRLGKGIDLPGNKSPLIWIHAVSMGETKAVVALGKLLKACYPNHKIIISSITETGHQEAKKSLPQADLHFFLPFDFSFIIRPIVKKLKPSLVIISETDLWFNFLNSAKEEGAKICLVNGKISARSCARYKQFSYFSSKIFSLFDHLCVQNAHYQDLFRSLGISVDKLSVTGNLKFDEPVSIFSQEEVQRLKASMKIKKEDFLIVVGSTHEPEEKQILSHLAPLLFSGSVKILLVPRHPERFDQVAKIIEQLGLFYGRYSCLDTLYGTECVILIDKMGLLKNLYQIAELAIVGGSFTDKVGGHNVLEPCFFGVPVLFGPYMFSQMELKELVLSYGAGKQIQMNQVSNEISGLLENKSEKNEMGENGLRLVSQMCGSTKRTLENINYLI